MKTHELKTWPEFFQPVIDGIKTFEIRKDDRDFQEGHIVRLMEWEPETGKYTGRSAEFRIKYIIKADRLGGDGLGIPMHYCVFSISPLVRLETNE